MKKQRSTKSALLMSALSLLLCFSMLVGTTFAWFTDSVTSGNNIIKAGNLDIDVKYDVRPDGTYEHSIDKVEDLFLAPSGAKKGLWEPGHTEVAYLKIENNGSLALKYQFMVESINEVTGKNADGEDIKLSDILLFAATKPSETAPAPYTRETAQAAARAEKGKLLNYSTDATELAAGAAHYVALVVYMPDEVGNEANYRGDDIPTINFKVTALATQVEAEFDSFGDDYDAEAYFGTYIELDAGGDLLGALASAKAGEPVTVKLNGDVEWPTEGHHGENDITPASEIVINGNGNTITATGSGVTPLGDVEAPMKLKNVKIVDKSVSYNESAWEFTYLEMGGSSLTCENVTFADEIQTGTAATFTDCTFESNEGSVYAVWVEDGSASFTNCTFTGYRGLKMHEAYGTEVSSVVVKNCTFKNLSKKPGIAIGTLNADTTVSVTDSSFINCQPGDQGLYIYETDTDVTTINFKEENNTVENAYDEVTMGGLYEYLPTLKKGSVLVLPAKTYITSGTFTIPDGVTIKGAEGAEVIIRQTSAAQDNIFNCEGDAVIENITFESNFKGYAINGAAKNHDTDGNITVINCKFKGIGTEKNWGVYKNLYGDLTIKGCTFDNYNNAICGVNNGGGSTTVITGCTFTNINGEAIGYVASTLPADFESEVIANNTGLTAENVIGY